MKFSISDVLQKASQLGQASIDAATEYLGAGFGYLRESLGKLPLVGSTEEVAPTADQAADEKHYFVEFGAADRKRMLGLTFRAISNTYDETLNRSDLWPAAQLGPEDVRWLRMIQEISDAGRQ